ncbi:hypothetical protein DIPPA_35039 [Diplonema papillatum]|nr:hypothetical protein DIPPA_35039 [Diplonema papillatum]
MGRELKTRLGKAYEQCQKEAKVYAQCVEGHLDGRGFGHLVCESEFRQYRACVHSRYHPLPTASGHSGSGAAPNPFAR